MHLPGLSSKIGTMRHWLPLTTSHAQIQLTWDAFSLSWFDKLVWLYVPVCSCAFAGDLFAFTESVHRIVVMGAERWLICRIS
jgi:hypothetical protein